MLLHGMQGSEHTAIRLVKLKSLDSAVCITPYYLTYLKTWNKKQKPSALVKDPKVTIKIMHINDIQVTYYNIVQMQTWFILIIVKNI